ncbi:MAG: hypothetical protein ACRDZ4_17525 [Egibacteraceae bacterium]
MRPTEQRPADGDVFRSWPSFWAVTGESWLETCCALVAAAGERER